jgi:hypothetical protein
MGIAAGPAGRLADRSREGARGYLPRKGRGRPPTRPVRWCRQAEEEAGQGVTPTGLNFAVRWSAPVPRAVAPPGRCITVYV